MSKTTTPLTIFWDFDGVLMDSNKVRDFGFEKVLAQYPAEEVEKLLKFHRENGGLSRYVKFRYFFEEVRGEAITEAGVKEWADRFSVIMRKLLVDPSLLIRETIDFVKKNHEKYQMYIVSGSDQAELRYLCRKMNIASCFKGIHGSPKPKTQWLKELLIRHNYLPGNCLMIGDSHNDYTAAKENNILFMAYNNSELELYSDFILNFEQNL